MSSFSYGKHTKKHIGVWLRHGFCEDVRKLIKESGQKRLLDNVNRVVVSEYDKETDEVWLEVWCDNLIDLIRAKHRYNVFFIKTKVNEQWVCEGDLGGGENFFE